VADILQESPRKAPTHMRLFLILLRIGVFLLGLAGSLGSGFLGYWWRNETRDRRPGFDQAVHDFRRRCDILGIDPTEVAREPFWRELEQEYRAFQRQDRAYPFLLAGSVIGLVGAVLALRGRDRSSAALLLVAALGPAVLDPTALRFSFALVLAGLLALGTAFLALLHRPPGPAGQTARKPPA
jgi:hypothetical protein